MGSVYTENADRSDWLQNCTLFHDPNLRKLVENINSIPNKQHDFWVNDFKYINWLGRAENYENCKREINSAENLSFIMEWMWRKLPGKEITTT